MKMCGISPSRTLGVYHTRSNYLTLYFKSDDQEKYTGFEMVITRFRYGMFTFLYPASLKSAGIMLYPPSKNLRSSVRPSVSASFSLSVRCIF